MAGHSERRAAFVTGATGFIGSHVVKCLLEKGWKVRALSRRKILPSFLYLPGVQWVLGNVLDRSSLERGMVGCDCVFHVAADYRLWAKNPAEIYMNNVTGTENVLYVAKKLGIPRVVYTSSVGALGLNRNRSPADEMTPVGLEDMVGHYKRSKFLAERVAERFFHDGLSVVIVNPSTPIGPGDHKPTPTGKIILDFLNGRMPAYVDTGLNFIHVKDVAVGHVLAYEKGQNGGKYILGNKNMTLKEFLRLLSIITGFPEPRIKLPVNLVMLIALLCESFARISGKPPSVPLEGVRMSRHFMFFDSSKAVNHLGLPQTPIEKAVKEAVAWYVSKGYVRRDRLSNNLRSMRIDC